MNLVLLLTQDDLYNDLYQEINRQNTFYFWIVGIVVSVSIAIAAFIGILQWRLSDKQISKMKSELIEDIRDKYIDEINDSIKSVNEKLDAHLELNWKNDIWFINSLSTEISLLSIKEGPDLAQQINKIVFNMKNLLDDNTLEKPIKAAAMYALQGNLENISKDSVGFKGIQNFIKHNEKAKYYMDYANSMFGSEGKTKQ